MTRNVTIPDTARPAMVGLLALAALVPLAAPAKAQMDPMIARQMQLQQAGNMMAYQGGMNAYRMMQLYRLRTGYAAPFPAFVTPQQQRQSAAALSQAYDNYRRSGANSSMVRSQAAENYSLHGILGQQTMVNPYTGQYYYNMPNDYNHVYVNPQGRWGSNSEFYRPWDSTELMPVR
jgi:hypothetical protein